MKGKQGLNTLLKDLDQFHFLYEVVIMQGKMKKWNQEIGLPCK